MVCPECGQAVGDSIKERVLHLRGAHSRSIRATAKIIGVNPSTVRYHAPGEMIVTDWPTWFDIYCPSEAVVPRPKPRRSAIRAPRRLDAGRTTVEYRTAVRLAKIRANGRCEQCGSRIPDFSKGSWAGAHHIRHYAEHPSLRSDLSNLIVVCGPCHKRLHKGEEAVALT